jgi:hypothetical protein
VVPSTATTMGTALLAALLLSTFLLAADHVVGDSVWCIPPSADLYSAWAANRTFVVGDNLGEPLPALLVPQEQWHHLVLGYSFQVRKWVLRRGEGVQGRAPPATPTGPSATAAQWSSRSTSPACATTCVASATTAASASSSTSRSSRTNTSITSCVSATCVLARLQ